MPSTCFKCMHQKYIYIFFLALTKMCCHAAHLNSRKECVKMYEFAVDIYVGCVHWLPQYFYLSALLVVCFYKVKIKNALKMKLQRKPVQKVYIGCSKT